MLSQSGYYSRGDSRLHFGLGKAAEIERIEVTWPGGLTEVFKDVKVNQTVRLAEGSGNAR